MEHLRRAAAALAAPLVATSSPILAAVIVPAGPAAAATNAATTAGASTIASGFTSTGATDPGQPIGGPQLAARGLVLNRGQGIPSLPKIPASSWVIADADTGQVLAARDPHGRYLPASTLKVLTAIALIPKLQAGSTVQPTRHTCDVEGSRVGMTPALRYKVSDLFKALLMVSGNDAALALTQAGGGLPRTLGTMNAEAKRLQAGDTLAGSPNGLDVDLGLNVKKQHTSAYDLALMMRQGLRLPDFTEYVGTVDAHWPAPVTKAQRKKGRKLGGYPIYTHNRLVRPGPYQYKGMIGGKNGYTNAALQTFVGAARRDGHTIIVSLMHSAESFWPYVPKMLDWGFAATGKVRSAGTLVEPVDTARPLAKAPQQQASPIQKIAKKVSSNEPDQWIIVAAAGTGVAMLGAGVTYRVRRRRAEPAPAGGPGMVPGTGPLPDPGMEDETPFVRVIPPGSSHEQGAGPAPGQDHHGEGPSAR